MAKLILILSTLFLSHEVLSQIIRQPENLNRNLIEALLESTRQESPRYIPQIDPFIQNPIANAIPDFPINIPSPVLNIPSPVLNIPNPVLSIPSPTNILNSAPSNPYPLLSNPNSADSSICKNLANTIQLMVLSDLLKTRELDDIALRLAAPVLSNRIIIPRASIRSGDGTNLINTLSLAPNVIPSVIPSVTNSPRIVISPNNSPNIISPSIMSSVSDGRIERGMLTNMLKYLGGAL